ncbi:hypothetical protein BCR36DRAFT_39851, partial [Piromyces finnis]
EKFNFIKKISLEEAKNTYLNLIDVLNLNSNDNIHMLFLYGVIQCLNSNDESNVIDLNDPLFKDTLIIGEYYRKIYFCEFQKNFYNESSLFINNIDEDFFTCFHNYADLSLLDNLIKKYEGGILDTEASMIDNSNKQNNLLDIKRIKNSVTMESLSNITTHKDNYINAMATENTKMSILNDNNSNNNLNSVECFKNVITIGLASLNYKYVELCSEYLYKLENDDISLKFCYLSLLQNCIYCILYKKILLNTANNIYQFNYIQSILKEQINSGKELYSQNNITFGWNRYYISKNYYNNFKNIPKDIDILILQHSLNKKSLYTGLICKENSQGKNREGNILFDFLEYDINFEEWKTLIKNFNDYIEIYEINSNMIDYIIRKEFLKREENSITEINNQTETENFNSEEMKVNNEYQNPKEDSENVDDNKKTKAENKKNKKKIKKSNSEKSNEEIDNKEECSDKYVINEEQICLEKEIEIEIKENIPENIISEFQNNVGKIIDYLKPIFDHYKKVINTTTIDKKKKSTKKSGPDQEKAKYSVIICCDETFLNLPLSLIFNYFSSWDIIYKEFSYNMLLHRYKEQFGCDKDSQSQNQEFSEVNCLNCLVNFDENAYDKKERIHKDIQINNINELKNILASNNIINKWPGSYFTKIQYAQLKHYFSPPGFLYMSYKRLIDDIPLNKFKFNLTGVNHAILLENISISKYKTKVYKLNRKDMIRTILLLSLYGINNIYYQPYIVDLNANKIILDTIFKCNGLPLKEVLLGSSYKSKVPISSLECFGLPTSLKIRTEKKESVTK